MQVVQISHPELSATSLEDRRLGQIRSRDPGAEGLFWYSVVTTGVYCRPTCPSRHARPENIRFHDSLAEAKATGFRSCTRCRPEEPSQVERHAEMVRAALGVMDDESRPLTGRQIAEAVGLSSSQFYKIFRRITGITPAAYYKLSVQARSLARLRSGCGR